MTTLTAAERRTLRAAQRALDDAVMRVGNASFHHRDDTATMLELAAIAHEVANATLRLRALLDAEGAK